MRRPTGDQEVTGSISILGMSDYEIVIFLEKNVCKQWILDQMPHSVASDLGLNCLPITLIGVSRLQWVKNYYG